MGRSLLVVKNPVLKSLHISQLRGVKDLDIDFSGSPVTGIFGLNGSGKTTILQTLVCLFRSKTGKENTKMSRFFKYTTAGDKWIGSSFSAVMDYFQLSGRRHRQENNKQIDYSKPGSEWRPRQASKPDRDVVYIKLSECIPDIEKVSESKVTFSPLVGEELDIRIANAATQIMGVRYEELKVNKIKKLDCFSVKRNGIICHSFNLGAGEQRVFRILQTLYRVPPYSLIVIDELDLTLHSAALRELIKVMVEEASNTERNLQIIFSSHRQELMKTPFCNIRFILNTPSKTFCLDNPTEDCYELLSGQPERYLKIYVEDDVAEAIVRKCLQECGMSVHGQICRFGSITNSVRLALGLSCQEEDLSKMDDMVFFCDGDDPEFTEPSKIRQQINRTLTGGEQFMQDRRDKVLDLIKHFNPSYNSIEDRYEHPEEFIHNALSTLNETDSSFPEIIRDSKAILSVTNHHDYVSKLLERGHTIRDVIEVVSTTTNWTNYTSDLKAWILARKAAHPTPI